MSASTRTVQRTLGTSQLGGMIVLLAVLAAIVGSIAFSTIGATKSVDPAVGAGANPVVDYVPRHEIGAPKQVVGYGGWNGPRLPFATDHANDSIVGPRLQAR
jgi:hypothetical protein